MARSWSALLAATTLAVAAMSTAPAAHAATTVIQDQASCEGAGGNWSGGRVPCTIGLKIPAGDRIELRVNTVLLLGGAVEGTLVANTSRVDVKSRGGLTVGSTGEVFVSMTGTDGLFNAVSLSNSGKIHVTNGELLFGLINGPNSHSNTGEIWVSDGAQMGIRALATLNNTGTIFKGCSGTINLESFDGSTAQIAGNAPVEDCVAPSAAPVVTPTPNAAGWVKQTPVSVEWNWSDNLAGIDTPQCVPSSDYAQEGEFAAESTCADLVGNKALESVRLKVDTAPPTAAPTVAGSVVTWNWTDGGSGLDGCDKESLASGTGRVTASSTCTDVAGNTTTATQDVTIADPVITPKSVQAGGTVTFKVAGFAAGEKVTATLFSSPVTLGAFTADTAGLISGTLTIPADTTAGAHTLQFAGGQSDVTTSVELTVTAAPTPASTPTPTVSSGVDSLSDTGAHHLTATVRLGGLLVLVGGLLLLIGQPRRRGNGFTAWKWLNGR